MFATPAGVGPGQYNTIDQGNNSKYKSPTKMGKFSKPSKHEKERLKYELVESPSPGDYQDEALKFKIDPTSGGKFAKDSRIKVPKQQHDVGPGQYDPEDKLTTKSRISNPMKSTANRNFDKFLKNDLMAVTPGPGQYKNVNKPKNQTSVKISTQTVKPKVHFTYKFKTPGPGQYEPALDLVKKKAPGATIKMDLADKYIYNLNK